MECKMGRKWAAALFTVVAFLNGAPGFSSTQVSLYSGTFESEHPAPALVGKVSRGDRFQLEVPRVSALVNYPGRYDPVVTERVSTIETGAVVTCPYFVKLDGSPMGTRVNLPHRAVIGRKVFCEDGSCTELGGQPIAKEKLLFGKYDLPKVKTSDGKDFGFLDRRQDPGPPAPPCPAGSVCGPSLGDSYLIACPEFSIERTYSELHYFERLLILENFREEEFLDLDVDFRKIYVTFEDERHERVNCPIPDLLVGGDIIEVGDLKDCVLPPGAQFTMYAQSRFFLKDTRPCGKFVTKGVKTEEGYAPDWFLGWYECDGKVDRIPIEKQYSYATRVELTFTKMGIGGDLR